MTLPPVEVKKKSSFLSLLHGINVASLNSGIYEFYASIIDSLSNTHINLSRHFEVIQMDYLNQKQALNYQQATIAGNYLKYIATPEQYKLYENLNLSGKAQFLIQFWQEKDDSHDINGNKYLARIKDRYNYANQHFGNSKQEGWSTDRGSILIKYGMPDEIENHSFETDSVPYEIWYYHQNKNYEFDFADLHNSGNYELVNSTKENEVQNWQWKELITN
ncbi:MAG: GWxTD domain-containing protein [Ignavibacteriaceae bacterium]